MDHRLLISRAVLIAIAAGLFIAAIIYRDRVYRQLREFFTAVGSPRNLAIFRIVLFTAIFFDLGNDMNPAILRFYSALPVQLQDPPPGWSHLMRFVPLNPAYASYSLIGIKVFAVLAAIGLFARTSGWIVTLLALYAMGIPQYFGKTNHVHHTLWFAAIVASSPCADALSIDALIRRWRRRRADESSLQLAAPAPAIRYELPLRFIWVLLGVIYFFPGFWKAWHCGIDWAFSDNFRNTMWGKWYDLGASDGFTPWVRIDQYPLLCHLMALGAIVFELSFIFLIFIPRLRWIAVVVGASFHVGTYVLMGIKFWSLLLGYVSFIKWRSRNLKSEISNLRSTSAPSVEDDPRHLPLDRRLPRGAVVVFAVIFIGDLLCGVTEQRDAWPVTCYPPFSFIEKPYREVVDVVPLDEKGERIAWDAKKMRSQFSMSRYAAMMRRLRSRNDPATMQAFWTTIARQDPGGLGRARRVDFYEVNVDTDPAAHGRELKRERAWSFEPSLASTDVHS